MPTASIDFTLASIAMILIAIGAISGASMVLAPNLDRESSSVERYYQIGRYLLLSRGDPQDWGSGGIPTQLGLASGNEPYGLDIDKVTRLNLANYYAVNYSTLWQALGVDDISFSLSVEPLFNLALSKVSSQIQDRGTIYNFTAQTVKDGYPISCQIRYYTVVGNSTFSSSGSTDSQGYGTIQFKLPNSLNGTALLIGIAKAEADMVSFNVVPFAHLVDRPNKVGMYATLSPLSFNLTVELEEGAMIWNTAAFSWSYSFNLTASGSNYDIPQLIDSSPILITMTGTNGTYHWAEWVAYPQVPLEVGADMEDIYTVSDLHLIPFTVEIHGAYYRFEISFRSPAEYD
ncbi:MAG: hypothetical protein PVJ38_06280 [Candidatus Bathyarchaeota archaeon]|jgi:hypothetical protein